MSDFNERNNLAVAMVHSEMDETDIHHFIDTLIPTAEMTPKSVEGALRLLPFADKLNACEKRLGIPFYQMEHSLQDAVVLRRLQQMINTLNINPHWRDRIATSGLKDVPQNFSEWQQLPLSDRDTMRDLYMGSRKGLVVPLQYGGFEIVASGGTSSGLPVESVYGLRELQHTYRIAGRFMGRHIYEPNLPEPEPKWVFTTLADYQMWSSGTMVGGVLQAVPNINYIGAGPVRREIFQHIMSYPGPKAILGISQGIAILTELGQGLDERGRASLRLAQYGSGVLPLRKELELKEMYPNLAISSYFAATQAETIGLQLNPNSSCLASVPGLHFIEIVDENGQWVKEGESGELVVTRLHAHRAPLIRLRLGDRMIRRSNIDTADLKTQQFEFAGRCGDVIHICDTQFAANKTCENLCQRLKTAGLFDLQAIANDIQFVNERGAKRLSMIASVDNAETLNTRMRSLLGKEGIRKLFMDALINSLSLFNLGEANVAYLQKSQYMFELRLVPPKSTEIHRTDVGKVPLIIDDSLS